MGVNVTKTAEQQARAARRFGKIVAREPERLWVAEAFPRPPANAIPPGLARVFLVLSGTRRVSLGIGGRAVSPRLGAGEAVYVPAHAWQRADDEADNVILIVESGRAGATAYLRWFSAKGSPRIRLGERRGVWPEAAARGLFDLVARLSAAGLAGAARAGATALLRQGFEAVANSGAGREGSRREALVAEIEQFLQENAGRALSRKNVAGRFKIHPNHLSRLFARHGTEGFAKRLAAARVQAAARVLAEGNGISVKEAAGRAGFGDARHFAKVFRRLMGVPPSRYVAAMRAG